MAKFKVGDRVRLIIDTDDTDKGQCGTVRENNSTCPWIYFDTPTRFSCSPTGLGIPDGYADCHHEDALELIEDESESDDEISLLQEVTHLASYYGVDITITTNGQTIHVKSNTKFSDN